jgi:GNAT superfamily N-acetyltransferase
VRFVFTSDINRFAERTRTLLAERIEHNVHATVVENLLAGHHAGVTPVLAIGLDPGEQVRFAALRTAPWFMLATELDDQAAAAFVDRWLAIDPGLPGVNAVPGTARAIAVAWRERMGGRTVCRTQEAIHVLDRVSESLRPAPGELRPVCPEERGLMLDWMRAFAIENGTIPPAGAEAMVDAPLARGALMVWDNAGPVSLVAFSPPVSGVVRIGPVYTPPEHRCHGYATNMVAAVSRRALAAGATRCMLYTDLANSTSNKIYFEIGYRRVADWEEHAFERARP